MSSSVKKDKVRVLKAAQIAKDLGAKIRIKPPNNRYGGYDNGSLVVWLDMETGKLRLVATCCNCGDGSWINITKLIK